ncbi:MAG: hypothetical protein IKJ99_08090 [Oscillospiraceae bacterium]|nr:hypothetical protein [Oscillospiraceae bacterium]
MFRKLLILTLALVMITVMIITWGSMGSALMAFLLIMMGAAVLYQRFLTNRDEDQFQEE